MKTVIIHGVKVSDQSPRHGRPECDLWGVTRCNVKYWNGKLNDWTAWHEYHPLIGSQQCERLDTRRPDNWEWMCRQDGTRPIYLHDPKLSFDPVRAQEQFDQVPGATIFPLEAVQNAFLVNGEENRHFDCQLGLMMAFALLKGYERIILNGIGTRGSELIMATHITTLYWIGFARGRGVDVVVEGPSIYQMPSKIYIFDDLSQPWGRGVSRRVVGEETDKQRRDRLRGRPVRV